MNSLRSAFSLWQLLSLSVEPCSQTQINGRNTSTGAFNSRPWKTGSVFKTSVHLYPPDLRSESVLPRERERERAVLGVGGEERLTSGNRSGSTLTCTLCHMNAARDFWSLQTCSPTGHSADGSQRDMLIVQCALQMLPKARSLTTDFSIFQYQTTVSEWFGTKYQYARTQTETENENSSGYSHQVKVDDLFCKQW